MAARIAKDRSARWRVIVPWVRNGQTSDVVAVEITANDKTELVIKVIGGREVAFPLERAKMLLEALQEAVSLLESE